MQLIVRVRSTASRVGERGRDVTDDGRIQRLNFIRCILSALSDIKGVPPLFIQQYNERDYASTTTVTMVSLLSSVSKSSQHIPPGCSSASAIGYNEILFGSLLRSTASSFQL